MPAKIEFFPVDNGDMTLITLDSGRTILVDCNIRQKATDENDPCFNALEALRSLLPVDDEGRSYVDVFLLSHPDSDHCRGFKEHFYQGSPDDRADDDEQIFIREIWSAPIVYRRHELIGGTLCEDAIAFRAEAKRRVKTSKNNWEVGEGDLIQILGHDVDHKTDDVEELVTAPGQAITAIASESDPAFEALLLAPLEPSEDADVEECRAKNHSSVIIRFTLGAGDAGDATKFLTGGDAHAGIWEILDDEYDAEQLEWDILLTPHHCSWRSLSNDSWSQSDNPQVSAKAKSALSHMVDSVSAVIVASSKEIEDNDDDPPSYAARTEYLSWINNDSDRFTCTAEHPVEGESDILRFEVSSEGLALYDTAVEVKSAAIVGSSTIEHG